MAKDKKNEIKKFFIKKECSIKDAMSRMDRNKEKVLFLTDDRDKLLGALTDGDIRRWILANGNLKEKAGKIYNRKPTFVKEGCTIDEIKKIMLNTKIEWIPVVDDAGQVTDVLIWDNVFREDGSKSKRKISIPAVIMAGGSGARLDPFTKILPKPLIPIKGRPIIEIIMDKLNSCGIEQFFVSVSYKSRIIKAYFEEADLGYGIEYITEHKPLGTAGCLRSLFNRVKGPILVTNCDIIIESDYSNIVDHHLENENDITVVGSVRHFRIPYGICEIKNGGILEKIKEKPTYDFLVNTGMYILNDAVLGLIPRGKVFHMTDLIKKVKEGGGKIGVFPISENSWIDVGQWEEYHRTVKSFKYE